MVPVLAEFSLCPEDSEGLLECLNLRTQEEILILYDTFYKVHEFTDNYSRRYLSTIQYGFDQLIVVLGLKPRHVCYYYIMSAGTSGFDIRVK